MRVLRGLAGLDMHQLDLLFDAPGQKVTAGQFGAVAATNGHRVFELLLVRDFDLLDGSENLSIQLVQY